jgi:predicted lactoylglutathione lyase
VRAFTLVLLLCGAVRLPDEDGEGRPPIQAKAIKTEAVRPPIWTRVKFFDWMSNPRVPDRHMGDEQRRRDMPKMIFVNLPVTDLKRATAFYEAIGATKNPQFSDDTASCMVFSDTIYAMLLTHAKYAEFTSKKIVDARTSSEVLIALSADSREDVDAMVGKAKAGGGSLDPTPTQDFGFMYGRSFEDPDGHIWEVMWMDVAAATTQPTMADA